MKVTPILAAYRLKPERRKTEPRHHEPMIEFYIAGVKSGEIR